jgi:hypothetical protein
MKKWNAPSISCVEISETEHNVFGIYYDNGYVGDGHLGLLTWDCPGSGSGSSSDSSSEDSSNDQGGSTEFDS